MGQPECRDVDRISMDGEKNPIRPRIIVHGAIGAAGLSAAMIASAAPPQKGFDAEIASYAQMMLAEGTEAAASIVSTVSCGLMPFTIENMKFALRSSGLQPLVPVF